MITKLTHEDAHARFLKLGFTPDVGFVYKSNKQKVSGTWAKCKHSGVVRLSHITAGTTCPVCWNIKKNEALRDKSWRETMLGKGFEPVEDHVYVNALAKVPGVWVKCRHEGSARLSDIKDSKAGCRECSDKQRAIDLLSKDWRIVCERLGFTVDESARYTGYGHVNLKGHWSMCRCPSTTSLAKVRTNVICSVCDIESSYSVLDTEGLVTPSFKCKMCGGTSGQVHVLPGCRCGETSINTFRDDLPAILYVYSVLAVEDWMSFTGYGISNSYANREAVHRRGLSKSGRRISEKTLYSFDVGADARYCESQIRKCFPSWSQDVEGFIREATSDLYYGSVRDMVTTLGGKEVIRFTYPMGPEYTTDVVCYPTIDDMRGTMYV